MSVESLPSSDRFVVRRVVGEGAYGRVYDVYDRVRGRVLALKRLKVADANALVRFKRESRALHELGHPNLVTVYDLFSYDDALCFTMELVDGVDFVRWVRGEDAVDVLTTHAVVRTFDLSRISAPSPEVPPADGPAAVAPTGSLPDAAGLERLRDATAQVARALEAIHGTGLIHRDIKGPNVLVDRSGRVVVLDFGVVGSIADHEGGYAGTPDYMAPEAEDGRPEPASDLYALGVMVYVALAGRLPYVGTHAQKRQLRRVAPPDALPEGVPEPLRRLVLELLAVNPAARPTPAEVIARLGAAPSSDESDPGRVPRAFLGRDAHLARLRAAADSVAAGVPHVVTVVGRAGVGKTALVERFLAERIQADRSTLVLRGRCYERESLPYKGLDEVVDALAARVGRADAAAAGLRAEALGALGRVFPVLGRALGWTGEEVAAPDAVVTRRLALDAMRSLLGAVAARGPLVVFADDLQWGDRESGAWLVDLLSGSRAPPVLVVLAWREDDAPAVGFVGALAHLTAPRSSVQVEGLRVADARALAIRALGGVAVDADALVRESGGNPAWLIELVEHARDRIEHRTRAGADARHVLDDVVAQRLAALDAPSRALVDLLALAGRRLPVRVLTRAAGLAESDLLDEATSGPLRRRRLLRTLEVGGRSWVDLGHERAREAIVARLDPGTRATLHARLADAWEAWGDADDETLATHHEAAGNAVRAHGLYVAAARRALAALADEHAADLLRRALAVARSAGVDARAAEDALAEVLVRLGHRAEAARVLLGRRDDGDAASVDRRRRAAEQLLRAGHVDAAAAMLRDLLPVYGLAWPTSRAGLVLGIASSRARLWLRGTTVRPVRGDGPDAATRQRLELLRELVAGLRVAAPLEGFAFQSVYLRAALDSGTSEHVAVALAMEAAFLGAAGPTAGARCETLLEEAARHACDADDPVVPATVELARAGVAVLSGRHALARAHAEAAETRLRERGVGVAPVADLVVAYLHTALWFLGDLEALDRRTRAARVDAERRDDALVRTMLDASHHATLALFLDDRPDLVPGRVGAALAGWSRERFLVPAMLGTRALAEARLYAGEGVLAYAECVRGWDTVVRAGTLDSQLGGVTAWELRARTEVAAAAATSGAERDRFLDDARASVVELLRYGAGWAEGLARLVEAGVASVVGDRPVQRERLRLAHRLLAGAGLAMHADVAWLHLGGLHGDPLLRDGAVEALRRRGIVRPEAAARCLAPGRWGPS